MDNLTHTLVGLMLARVGLEKTTPRGAGMMMLAANIPDIDAVFWFGGTLPYLSYHRTYTHSLAFLPLVALLPMLLVWARFSWQAYLASMTGVLSHLLLDWTNAYGIPLALPFSAHHFRLDMVNIVDFWIWAILLGALAATALVTLLTGKEGRRGWAWAALLALVMFDSGRFIAHGRAMNTAAAQLYEGARPRRVTALPGPRSPLAWRAVVEGEGFVRILPVNLTSAFDPQAGIRYPLPPHIPAMDAALRTRPFQVFRHFSELPFWEVTALPEGMRVELIDLRFGTPESPGLVAVAAIVDKMGNVLRAGFGL